MILGGLQHTSFCDFPGFVSAVVFTKGCNFNCPFCHNRELIPQVTDATPAISETYLQQFLEERKDQIDGIVVSGGEPTIQPGLAAFFHSLKKRGYLTKLDTNGSNPEVLRSLMEQDLLDFIAMDIKAPWEKYNALAGCQVDIDSIRKSIRYISSSQLKHQFRTTWYPKLLTDSDIQLIKRQLPDPTHHHVQNYRS